ncbi:MAG: hypothetical protein Q4D19_04165 [Lautropia sp.]|nr:hypothetical protein [Lautropia sp.]
MTIRFSPTVLAAAIGLACGPAFAADSNEDAVNKALEAAASLVKSGDPAPKAPSPRFKPTTGCEAVKGYDPDWASHGDNYGLNRKTPKASPDGELHEYVWGFYQMREHEGTLYAAFGGHSAKGSTPGAVLAFDADTFTLKKAIRLPFATHALALSNDGKRMVATHTAANAFSLINLEDGSATCHRPDTTVDGLEHKGRYVELDEQGNFYINYNVFTGQSGGMVMKYTPDGQHASDFDVNITEKGGMVIPLKYHDGKLYTGNHGLKAVDAKTGEVSSLGESSQDNNFYNYIPGPGGTLLGSNYNAAAHPNMVVIDPATGEHRSEIFTALNTVELGWVPEARQVFGTNYESHTLSVAMLSDEGEFVPGEFANIVLDGEAATLQTRRTHKGTDVFVAVKHWEPRANLIRGARLHRIHIAPKVQGVEGLARRGACTITTFDMRTRKLSRPVACKILDSKQSMKQARKDIERVIADIRKDQQRAQARVAKMRAEIVRAERRAGETPDAETQAKIARQKEEAESYGHWLKYLGKNLRSAEAGRERLQQM